MSKVKPQKSKKLSIADMILQQQRALEAGKAGYKQSDKLLEDLETEIKEGRLTLGAEVNLGNGQTGKVIDRFADKSKVGAGLSVRRYEVEITRAADITSKL